MSHWIRGGQTIAVRDAPTIFGTQFGSELTHNEPARTVTIDIRQPAPADIRYIYPCRLGMHVVFATANGAPATVSDNHVLAPGGTNRIELTYAP